LWYQSTRGTACDNCAELPRAAMPDWAGEREGLHFIPPGLQLRNSYIESFNSGMRHECLHINSFWSWPKPTL
jgi:putative transposase